MATLVPYLLFSGTCREAMTFYQHCLGGQLDLQEVADTPMAEQTPEAQRHNIMHSSLIAGSLTLFASDMLDANNLKANETTNLCLNFTDADEVKATFAKLSDGATIGHELKEEFWGATYGDLVDKYGFRWMFNYSKPQNQ